MKHNIKITLLLLTMFFVTQLIGIYVVGQYTPKVIQITNPDGEIENFTSYNLPYGVEPPQQVNPSSTLISIIIATIIAVSLMFILMKYNAEMVIRIWFFVVVSLAIGITFNSFLLDVQYSSLIAILVALPLAFFKIFKRNIIVHNLTELIIYPGIAAIFVPLLNLWGVIILLVLISVYDMWAVWHSGIMQKMAKYQIQKIKVFSGFFVPYIGNKERDIIKSNKKSKLKNQKVKVSVAILGGGDVVFPIFLAGVVLSTMGPLQAIIVSICATLALAGLFWLSEKGKFYPAMPFITAGCFIGLAIAYFI